VAIPVDTRATAEKGQLLGRNRPFHETPTLFYLPFLAFFFAMRITPLSLLDPPPPSTIR